MVIKMKRIKKQYMMTIIAGVILVFLGIFFQVSNLAKGVIPLIFMNAGTIMIVIAVLSHNRYGVGVTQDERTRALGARALSYSWLLTFVLVNVLFWIDYTDTFTFVADHILGIILFTMVLSAGIIQSVFKQRGTIDED
jgi:hypothetical protein